MLQPSFRPAAGPPPMVCNPAVYNVAREASRRRLALPGLPKVALWERWVSPVAIAQLGPSMAAQGDDLARGLLLFAEGKPLSLFQGSAGWLAINLAWCLNLDATGLDGLIGVVEGREAEWARIAQDPLGNLDAWTTARRPWSALAAILEWVAFRASPLGQHVSHLPIGLSAAHICRAAEGEILAELSGPALYSAVTAAASHGVSAAHWGPGWLATHAPDTWFFSYLAVDAFTRIARFDESEDRREEREARERLARRRAVGAHLRLVP